MAADLNEKNGWISYEIAFVVSSSTHHSQITNNIIEYVRNALSLKLLLVGIRVALSELLAKELFASRCCWEKKMKNVNLV
mmetsp:Transcript_22481/g.62625  ORF Transcript_22481/g.62625 Transcript_22481/m.62625 type:complete len:80 (+) Transcript_22481:1454-1693(+)